MILGPHMDFFSEELCKIALSVRHVGKDVLRDYTGMNPMAAKAMGFKNIADYEILVRKGLSPKEDRETVKHELVEYEDMRKGTKYWDAHEKALKLEKEAQVDPYQQKTQWTCSAACFKAVLAHYGIKIPELHALQLIGTRPHKGADTDEIMWAAHKLGLDAFEYSFDSLDQAKWLLDQDIPIIADIQSFKHPGKGHYVIITKIDGAGVHLMDPNTEGNQRLISRKEMDERWWDARMKPPHTHMPKWGVVILPPGEE